MAQEIVNVFFTGYVAGLALMLFVALTSRGGE